MRTSARWLILGLLVASPSHAYFLDQGRRFDFRLRAYSQVGIMTDSSEKDWPGNGPNTCIVNGKESSKCRYSAGDLAQHRNFYYPEFDAKLTDFTPWMHQVPGLSLITPDDFKFRFAWWGFYDGLYDYLNGPWNFNRRNLKARFSQSNDINKESFTFNDENKNPRHIYARRDRINELYLDYKKGPLFLRAGRQSISWGESDDIVFMDRLNAFDLTLGAPGLYQDLDEARIPFWALRATYKVLDNWKAFSSVFGDAFVVPGVIDTTVPIDPIVGGVSPFTPDVKDPQLTANDLIKRNGFDPRTCQGRRGRPHPHRAHAPARGGDRDPPRPPARVRNRTVVHLGPPARERHHRHRGRILPRRRGGDPQAEPEPAGAGPPLHPHRWAP